jgi:predicted XRE-type DNA-binding protein
MAKLAVERGSGNVFADLGFPDAKEHKLKAGLVAKLGIVLLERNLTQTAAAEMAGIDQPDLSRLLRGQFRNFSVERLMRILSNLDYEIQITVRHHGHPVGEPLMV